VFQDRIDAGRKLGDSLARFRSAGAVVLGLPRGGVIVAAEVARALGAPLDIVVVRKIGSPQQPELAIGAVVSGGQAFIDHDLVRRLDVSHDYLQAETRRQLDEISRREILYRGGKPGLTVAGKTAIVVDDGVATGATTRIALRAVRAMSPSWLVLAVPVGAPETLESLAAEADEVVALEAPRDFRAVGQWYADFEQTPDEEVVRVLQETQRTEPEGAVD